MAVHAVEREPLHVRAQLCEQVCVGLEEMDGNRPGQLLVNVKREVAVVRAHVDERIAVPRQLRREQQCTVLTGVRVGPPEEVVGSCVGRDLEAAA